ncbi:hypothetical protein D3C79_620540 [compost metagenome]
MLVNQIGRQVHTDEHHLEATDEKAQGQQPETGMRASFAQGLAEGLLIAGAGQRPITQQTHQRHDKGHQQTQYQQGRRPAQPADQAEGAGQHGELAEGAGGAGDAHGHAAFLWRHGAADHAQDHRERGAGQADTDQQAGTERQGQGRVRHTHQHQPDGIENTADHDHLGRPQAISQGTGKRLGQAPDQVLQGDGEGEHTAAPAKIGAHRRQEQAKAMSHAQRQRQDQRRAEENPTTGSPYRCHFCCLQSAARLMRVYTRL